MYNGIQTMPVQGGEGGRRDEQQETYKADSATPSQQRMPAKGAAEKGQRVSLDTTATAAAVTLTTIEGTQNNDSDTSTMVCFGQTTATPADTHAITSSNRVVIKPADANSRHDVNAGSVDSALPGAIHIRGLNSVVSSDSSTESSQQSWLESDCNNDVVESPPHMVVEAHLVVEDDMQVSQLASDLQHMREENERLKQKQEEESKDRRK
jgi:hypothetical protein